ncbi:PDZ domain-containing protein [Rossellomorea sp. BNER]|uniref:PDZ domain-containing protein n=1 Tax=Rossellomorea sp. BNER TaxID=2962031 RepID=UPI003AF216AF|nr:PDZ domain-containing protein [Rossellomorea sp. BNER]
MLQLWFLDLVESIGKFFIHPIFYISIILTYILGLGRVKQERKYFHTRVYDLYHELRFLFPLGFLLGISFSLITIATGMTTSMGAIMLIAVVTLLTGVTLRLRLLTPAITIGIPFLVLFIIKQFEIKVPVFSAYFNRIDEGLLTSLVLLAGLLLLIEGILIKTNGWKKTTPLLIKSPRGLNIGAHRGKKLWLVPMFLLIPGGELALPFEWWPVISVGEQTFSLVLIPFLIGFQQLVKSTLPQVAIKYLGNQVFWLGAFVITLAIIGIYVPLFMVFAVVTAIIGREWVSFRHRSEEESKSFYFSQREKGLMVLAVIPGSPAEKMTLEVGEVIEKVNGVEVHTERGLYEAIQNNRAYCKLEVIDVNGQIRFAQGALYEDDHHELGIVVVGEGKKWSKDAM